MAEPARDEFEHYERVEKKAIDVARRSARSGRRPPGSLDEERLR